jgi:hypothetical protein
LPVGRLEQVTEQATEPTRWEYLVRCPECGAKLGQVFGEALGKLTLVLVCRCKVLCDDGKYHPTNVHVRLTGSEKPAYNVPDKKKFVPSS